MLKNFSMFIAVSCLSTFSYAGMTENLDGSVTFTEIKFEKDGNYYSPSYDSERSQQSYDGVCAALKFEESVYDFDLNGHDAIYGSPQYMLLTREGKFKALSVTPEYVSKVTCKTGKLKTIIDFSKHDNGDGTVSINDIRTFRGNRPPLFVDITASDLPNSYTAFCKLFGYGNFAEGGYGNDYEKSASSTIVSINQKGLYNSTGKSSHYISVVTCKSPERPMNVQISGETYVPYSALIKHIPIGEGKYRLVN